MNPFGQPPQEVDQGSTATHLPQPTSVIDSDSLAGGYEGGGASLLDEHGNLTTGPPGASAQQGHDNNNEVYHPSTGTPTSTPATPAKDQAADPKSTSMLSQSDQAFLLERLKDLDSPKICNLPKSATDNNIAASSALSSTVSSPIGLRTSATIANVGDLTSQATPMQQFADMGKKQPLTERQARSEHMRTKIAGRAARADTTTTNLNPAIQDFKPAEGNTSRPVWVISCPAYELEFLAC